MRGYDFGLSSVVIFISLVIWRMMGGEGNGWMRDSASVDRTSGLAGNQKYHSSYSATEGDCTALDCCRAILHPVVFSFWRNERSARVRLRLQTAFRGLRMARTNGWVVL
jgi:hypothetical protein